MEQRPQTGEELLAANEASKRLIEEARHDMAKAMKALKASGGGTINSTVKDADPAGTLPVPTFGQPEPKVKKEKKINKGQEEKIREDQAARAEMMEKANALAKEGKLAEAKELVFKYVEEKRNRGVDMGKAEKIKKSISKGIELWDNWGKEEKNEAGVVTKNGSATARLTKTAISIAVTGATTYWGVGGLDKLGMNFGSKILESGATTFLGKKILMGVAGGVIANSVVKSITKGKEKINKLSPKEKKVLMGVTLAVVAATGGAAFFAAGTGILAAGATPLLARGAAGVVGFGVSRLTRKYEGKIKNRVNEAKSGTTKTIDATNFDNFEASVAAIEADVTKVLKEADVTRMWGKFFEVGAAALSSTIALEAAGFGGHETPHHGGGAKVVEPAPGVGAGNKPSGEGWLAKTKKFISFGDKKQYEEVRDAKNNLITRTFPDGHKEIFATDSPDHKPHLTEKVDKDGTVYKYTGNGKAELLNITHSDNTTEFYEKGERVQIDRPDGTAEAYKDGKLTGTYEKDSKIFQPVKPAPAQDAAETPTPKGKPSPFKKIPEAETGSTKGTVKTDKVVGEAEVAKVTKPAVPAAETPAQDLAKIPGKAEDLQDAPANTTDNSVSRFLPKSARELAKGKAYLNKSPNSSLQSLHENLVKLGKGAPISGVQETPGAAPIPANLQPANNSGLADKIAELKKISRDIKNNPIPPPPKLPEDLGVKIDPTEGSRSFKVPSAAENLPKALNGNPSVKSFHDDFEKLGKPVEVPKSYQNMDLPPEESETYSPSKNFNSDGTQKVYASVQSFHDDRVKFGEVLPDTSSDKIPLPKFNSVNDLPEPLNPDDKQIFRTPPKIFDQVRGIHDEVDNLGKGTPVPKSYQNMDLPPEEGSGAYSPSKNFNSAETQQAYDSVQAFNEDRVKFGEVLPERSSDKIPLPKFDSVDDLPDSLGTKDAVETAKQSVLDKYGTAATDTPADSFKVVSTGYNTYIPLNVSESAILRDNPEFAENYFNLTPKELVEVYNVQDYNLNKIFQIHEDQSAWQVLKGAGASSALKEAIANNPENTVATPGENLKYHLFDSYLVKLARVSGLTPNKGGWFSFQKTETIEEFAIRALQKAEQMGRLDEVTLK